MLARLFLLVLIFGMPQWLIAADMSFSDQTQAAGLVFSHSVPLDHRSGPMAAGGAVGDFNGDGYPDLYVIGGGEVADALFINNRDGTFSDQADSWGLTVRHRGVAATVADYDDDGDDDLYVTSQGPVSEFASAGKHLLYRNDGGVFVNVAEQAGVATTAPYPDGYGAAFGDYDRDGDLDLFVGAWHGLPSRGARLFQNDGDGIYTNVTEAAGVITDNTHAFGAIWADMDGDRYPELLVAGDFGTNRYYRNNRDGTFAELDPGSGQVLGSDSDGWSIGNAYNAMGTAVGDFNHDGRPDWFVTAIWPAFSFQSDFWGNGLYINQGGHIYTELAETSGVHDGGWGWGTSAVDLDNDGWTDLIMTNGWPHTDPLTGATFTDERSYLWRNRGDLSFAEVGVAAGLEHSDGQGRALLHLDYDLDGDIDIAILSNNEPMQFFRNELIGTDQPADANWLQVRLDTSANDALAPHGAGALIRVEAGDLVQTQQVTTGGTYLGQNELVSHFGLGSSRKVHRISVDWGNGKVSILRGRKANQRITVLGPCPPRGGGPLQPGLPAGPRNCSNSAANRYGRRLIDVSAPVPMPITPARPAVHRTRR